MSDNYGKIIRNNLESIYSDPRLKLEQTLPASKSGIYYDFEALGKRCSIRPEGVFLDEKKYENELGMLITLYALNSGKDILRMEPLKAFSEFPGGREHVAGFWNHSQEALVPIVSKIKRNLTLVMTLFDGEHTVTSAGGDFSILLKPFPKIGICYIFYEADEELSASVSCLFSNNASRFLPETCLADLCEYTSTTIKNIITGIT